MVLCNFCAVPIIAVSDASHPAEFPQRWHQPRRLRFHPHSGENQLDVDFTQKDWRRHIYIYMQ